MNERLQEFAKQAGLDTSTPEFSHMSFQERFAELIVRECVAICQDVDGEEDSMARCGRQDCAVEIREHFGVKE